MTKGAVGVAWVLAAVSVASAVKPGVWSHSTEKDFAAGKLDKTVVSSLGEVMLARATETLVKPREDIGMISAMAVDGKGRVFLATAPDATIYRLEKDKLVKFAKVPGVLVRHLSFEKDSLLVGTCGKEAGLYRLDGKGRSTPLWKQKGVTYVWAVVPGKGGSYYVATGAEGKLYHVQAGGKAAVIYDSDDENILSLAAGAKGTLYAGTGENGLVIEIDPARKKGRVLYDAAETEISRIVVGADGVIYAATSDSTKAGPSGEVPSAKEQGAPDAVTRPAPQTLPAKAGGAGSEKKPAPPKAKSPAAAPPKAKSPAAAPAKAVRKGAKAAATQPGPTTGPAGGEAPPIRISPAKIREMMAKAAGGERPDPKRIIVFKGSGPVGPPMPSRPSGPPGEREGKGNAVYRIDAQGFVRSVFRRPVTILDMTLQEKVLILATGHGGQVFAVDAQQGRTSMVVKLDPKDITVLAADAKGKLYLGTADKAGVYSLGRGPARKGTLICKVLDARQIAEWGTVAVRANVPGGCTATLAARSGNVAKPDEKTWSSWSREMPVDRGWRKVTAPPARFLQYRLTLAGNGKLTPAVDQVQLVYQVRNLPPRLRAVRVTPSRAPNEQQKKPDAPMPYRMIQVEASDPNGDPLVYAFYFRRVEHKRWIKLVDKFAQPRYLWDTAGVADGIYEVRAVAADALTNPPSDALEAARISRPVAVDNTPPAVSGLAAKPAGKGELTLSGTVAEAVSRVVKIHYSVDTNTHWIPVLPKDGICDSQKETFSVLVAELKPGTHRLAVRAVDVHNNTGYGSIEVTVGK